MPTRILLVEDDPSSSTPSPSCSPDPATAWTRPTRSNGRSSSPLDSGGAHPYQLILLDVTLRQGNGFAVCAAVKEATPDVPVIFLTASDDEFNTVTGLTMGADDYVAKPFRPRELLARIAATIRRSQPSTARGVARPHPHRHRPRLCRAGGR